MVAQRGTEVMAAARDAQAAAEAAAEAMAQVGQAAERHRVADHAAAQAAEAAGTAARQSTLAAKTHREATERAKQLLADQLNAEYALSAERAAAGVALAAAAASVASSRAELDRALAAQQSAQRAVQDAQRVLDAQQDRQTWWTGLTGALGVGELAEARRMHRSAMTASQVTQARLTQSRDGVSAAIAAQSRTRERADRADYQRQEELSQAAERAQVSRAQEPERAVLRADAVAAAMAAQHAQIHAEALAAAAAATPPPRSRWPTATTSRRDPGASAAAQDAEQASQGLADAQAAAVQARAAAAAAADRQAAAAEQARVARSAADELHPAGADRGSAGPACWPPTPVRCPTTGSAPACIPGQTASPACGSTISLEHRWFELIDTAAAEGHDLRQVGEMLVNTANLVCCTTTGFGGKIVENADFDTLIVDEASRVVDSEFLIGAIKARRWILVGDEKQLPPYVDPVDEHHLHALAALHLADSDGPGRRVPSRRPWITSGSYGPRTRNCTSSGRPRS